MNHLNSIMQSALIVIICISTVSCTDQSGSSTPLTQTNANEEWRIIVAHELTMNGFGAYWDETYQLGIFVKNNSVESIENEFLDTANTFPNLIPALYEAASYLPDESTAKKLLKLSIDPCALKMARMSALEIAVSDENLEDVKYLLDKGCDPDAFDKLSDPVLNFVISEDLIDIAMLLLEYGADPDLKGYSGMTARNLAQIEGLDLFDHP